MRLLLLQIALSSALALFIAIVVVIRRKA